MINHCQYFAGRRGQCPEFALHRITRLIRYYNTGGKGGVNEARVLLYLCDTHLMHWFEDQEEIVEPDKLRTPRSTNHKPSKREIEAKERDEKIMALYAEHPELSYRKMAEQLGINPWSVRDCILKRHAYHKRKP